MAGAVTTVRRDTEAGLGPGTGWGARATVASILRGRDERRDGLQAMRRSALLAAAAWAGLHVLVGVVFLDFVARPLVFGLALLVLAAGSVIATRPLWDRTRDGAEEPRSELVLLSAAVPVVAVLVALSSQGGTVLGYPSWVAGAVGVMLAALALRAGLWWAEATALVTLLVQVLLHAAGPVTGLVTGLGPVSLEDVVRLAVPAQMWVVGTWTAGRFLRRTADLTTGFRARSALESAERQAADGWAAMRRRRVGDLEGEVLPLMREVSALDPGGVVPEDLRRRSRELAEALRDSLLTRTLMIPELRTSVRAARQRGVAVMLTSELFHGDRVVSLRELVEALLCLPGLTSLTVHALEQRGAQPAEATVLMGRDLDEADIAPLVADLRDGGWGEVDLVRLDQELMVRLLGPR